MPLENKILMSLITFKEVNFSLRDIGYLDNIAVNRNRLLFDVDFDVRLKEKEHVEILLHIEYVHLIDENTKELTPIFHGDFISIFKMDAVREYLATEGENVLLKKEVLESMLGITVSTTRGYLLAKTKGSAIYDFPLPIIYPQELIDSKLEKEEVYGDFFPITNRDK